MTGRARGSKQEETRGEKGHKMYRRVEGRAIVRESLRAMLAASTDTSRIRDEAVMRGGKDRKRVKIRYARVLSLC